MDSVYGMGFGLVWFGGMDGWGEWNGICLFGGLLVSQLFIDFLLI